ncbi:pancreatic lipase-related protein 2-like [Biomphalaria glabrata]|uniref:Pancreatic lipase-related protein 2-like n=3 Tax=Biomphalaria TaxID=6525 RepID=A0A9W3A1W4_BIOGL|nr:pancreatic lipase-related protein 2-like [Biomphalaria glabrata]
MNRCLAFVLLCGLSLRCTFVAGLTKLNEVCYPPLGCFSTDPPFDVNIHRPVTSTPESPETIKTVFKLYTQKNRQKPTDLKATQAENVTKIWSNFIVRPVKVIIHGYYEDVSLDTWMKKMKDELLIHGDYNVIIVDWSLGAKSTYSISVANARLVGAQLASVIQKIVDSVGIPPLLFHIIGHSLGAHVAGYTGEKINGLGRISGLDPAGLYFENTDPKVRLDPSDAIFVDVIHTDCRPLPYLGLGTFQALGHYDFYPNLGHDMPGCLRNPVTDIKELGLREGVKETFGCNHIRSITYFMESINTKCPFTAYPCNGEADFLSGECKVCGAQKCARMGFHCEPSNGVTQTFYLTTAGSKPYCQYHYEINIKLSTQNSFSEMGIMFASAKGTSGVTKTFQNQESSTLFKTDQTLRLTLTHSSDIGEIQSVTLRWEREAGTLATLLWNLFWQIPQKIYIERVQVYTPETNKTVGLCAYDRSMDHDQTLLINSKC